VPALLEYITASGRKGYYENAFGLLVEQGAATMHTLVVGDLPWYEIDALADLLAAEERFGRI
jgi:NDP-sugar pyrophosphorylase family protein